ncbi:hypothetical protein [Nonomuraea sp. NPDC049129]|uniref:hypothetical protein n=1 Tax=Nonomuraea sp. NPDC049129 TaxID=3155272 RepID=UPI0034064504
MTIRPVSASTHTTTSVPPFVTALRGAGAITSEGEMVEEAMAARRLAWVIMAKRNHAGSGPSCDGESCSTTNEGPYQTAAVRGYYLTPGTQVTVQVKRASDDRVLWQGRTTAQAGGNGPSGSYSLDTGRVLCGGSSFAPPLTAYVMVRGDGGQWSPRVPYTAVRRRPRPGGWT